VNLRLAASVHGVMLWRPPLQRLSPSRQPEVGQKRRSRKFGLAFHNPTSGQLPEATSTCKGVSRQLDRDLPNFRFARNPPRVLGKHFVERQVATISVEGEGVFPGILC
jgi:hypothetical protein